MVLSRILLHGSIFSLIASIWLIVTLWLNPRWWLQNYTDEIQAKVPPKTEKEKKMSLWIGIPFLLLLFGAPFYSTWTLNAQLAATATFWQLFWNAFGVATVFNLVDLLILDWLMFCIITPKFIIVPGTEGMPGYKDYGYHFRGFLIGSALSVVSALLFAGIISIL